MKNNKVFVISVTVALMLAFYQSVWSQAKETSKTNVTAVVTQVIGELSVQRYGEAEWGAAQPGAFLYQGDVIKTNSQSRAVIVFSNGAEVKVASDTEFELKLSELGMRASRDRIKMKKGEATCGLRAKAGKVSFSIETPVALVSVRGTKFNTRVEEDGETSVLVFEGIVSVENEFGSVKVRKNRTTNVEAGAAPEPPTKVSREEIEKRTKWEKDIEIKTKTLKIKFKTEDGEEKTLKLKFKK